MSKTEWVPGDWSTLSAGEKVILEHGDGTTLDGTAQRINKGKGPLLGVATAIGWRQPGEWERSGWSLLIASLPKNELPTEPGAIIMWRDGAYLPHIAQHYPEGVVVWYTDDSVVGQPGDGTCWVTPAQLWSAIVKAGGTFTRLAPEPETAAKVLDRVREAAILTYSAVGDLSAIAAEFGVTE